MAWVTKKAKKYKKEWAILIVYDITINVKCLYKHVFGTCFSKQWENVTLCYEENIALELQNLEEIIIFISMVLRTWTNFSTDKITNEFKYISTKKFIVFLYHSVSVDTCVAYFKRHSYFSEFMKIRNLQIHKTVYFQV